MNEPQVGLLCTDLDQKAYSVTDKGEVVSPFDYREEFATFKKMEPNLWNPPRPEDELVPPSGHLDSPIAHHLYNPSFATMTPRGGETADETNPCIWLVMANGLEKGRTLIFDHLARREVNDGIKAYPARVLQCHEAFLAK
jgi:hypothetical protein